jgi:hypothetical protein
MLETLDSMRAFAAGIARRLQEECAAIAAAARDQNAIQAGSAVVDEWVLLQRDLACRLQRQAAARHAAAFEALDWTLDEPFLVEWCNNINRRREEERADREAREAREIARLEAMTPEQRAGEIKATRVAAIGLFGRDVQ